MFSSSETTNHLYQDIAKPLVVSAVEGYNGTANPDIRSSASCSVQIQTAFDYDGSSSLLMHYSPGTIFAYGQTSSGKTFTMMGSKLVPGVIPLSMEEVFQTIQNVRRTMLRVEMF